MAGYESVKLTVICMVCDGGRILMQNRVKEEWRGYALPGGKVEAGEPFVQAVIREVREETGLTISRPRLCGLKQWQDGGNGRYVVILFRADEFSGQLRSSEEGEMVWVNREDLEKQPLSHGFLETLRVYEDPDATELYYERGKEDGEWEGLFF